MSHICRNQKGGATFSAHHHHQDETGSIKQEIRSHVHKQQNFLESMRDFWASGVQRIREKSKQSRSSSGANNQNESENKEDSPGGSWKNTKKQHRKEGERMRVEIHIKTVRNRFSVFWQTCSKIKSCYYHRNEQCFRKNRFNDEFSNFCFYTRVQQSIRDSIIKNFKNKVVKLWGKTQFLQKKTVTNLWRVVILWE